MKNKSTIASMQEELDWLSRVINQVISKYFNIDQKIDIFGISAPDLSDNNSVFATFIKHQNLDTNERILLALVLASRLRPEILDVFFIENKNLNRNFTEFGGAIQTNNSPFIPTCQTFFFIISSINPELRIVAERIINQNLLFKQGIIKIHETEKFVSRINAIISLSESWFQYFITDELTIEDESDFCQIQKLNTPLTFTDLILDDSVMTQVKQIDSWIKYEQKIRIDWELSTKLKPGYKAFFLGPPETGKTLTASLLGKHNNLEVYRVNTPLLASKYVGETEKNIAKLFDKAKYKRCILFFDNAEFLFSQKKKSQHNSFIATYLLQQIEVYDGVAIVSSEQKIDNKKLGSYFQSIIYFNKPDVQSRLKLWQNAFSNGCKLTSEINLIEIAENYEVTAGNITNILRNCALEAIKKSENSVSQEELLSAINRELNK